MFKPKEKKCKGTGKAKGYGCGKMTMFRKYGLCKSSCYPNWLLHTEQGKIELAKATLKATKNRRTFEKHEKEYKESRSLPKEIQLTQTVFNKYIRLRDQHKPCISSLSSWRPDFDAGHLFSQKQYSELRFDEDNVHGQSIGDNRFKEGNFEDYLNNLKFRIGEERVKALLKRAEIAKQRVWKWTIEDLRMIRKKYNEKIKELQKGNQ